MTNTTIANVKAYLLDNMEELKQVVRELNSWDGSFENLESFDNDEEFFNMFFEDRPMEAVRAAHFGDYNYGDDFVRFNGYGNLESFNDYDLEQELKDEIDEIIDAIIEKRQHIYLEPELEELLDEEEEDEE
jgi:hypothetical protein